MLKKSKSYLIMVIAILTILAFQSFAFAGENQLLGAGSEPVSHNISTRDEEFKTISYDGNEEDVPVSNDIEVGENEAKVVSVGIDASDDAIVGEDIEIGEGEFKIISMPLEDEEQDNSYLKYILIGGVLVLGSALFTQIYKKST